MPDASHRTLPGPRRSAAPRPGRPRSLRFAVVRHGTDPVRDAVADAIVAHLDALGHARRPAGDAVDWVLNLTDTRDPRIFRRRSRGVFVISLVAAPDPVPEDLRTVTYTTLVRSLSNLLVCVVPATGPRGVGEAGTSELYFTTPEVGFYHHPFDAARACERILPIAGARMVIGNTLRADLPARLRAAPPAVAALRRFGTALDRLGVLPTPFPIREVLAPDAIAHLYRLFQVKGLSYGNLSTREDAPELGSCTFWMTARGVDKSRLGGVGRDVLLVTGYDAAAGSMRVSVPPEHDPTARVSVDAIEHYLIYRAFPDVGAVVHVHAWLDDVPCTRQNFPCGTLDLAQDVVRLLACQADPARTAVGLKNHGLTITGPSLSDIFIRLRGRLRTQVPMFG